VLFVGRLHSDKNLETLVRALNEVLTDKSVVAVLSGDGPSRERLTELARGGGHSDRLLVPGFLGGLWSMLKRADVFVSVSVFEGRPNAVLEAMACGCPVVVSDIPAHREILSNECALFVDGSDVGAIAAAIRCALNDPAAARARARLAEARTTDWSVSAMVARYEEVYLQLVTSPRLSKP
jgi:glycosyltransferase involved in cell wall biosynthesis